MMSDIRRAACLLLVLGVLLSCGPSQGRRESPADSITAMELRDRIFFLASDALEGRYLGSRGYQIAAQYSESQFKAAGLIPIVSQGNQKTYLQSVPTARRTADSPLSLVLKIPSGEQTFGQGKDFRWLEGDLLPWEKRPVKVVFAGYGIIEPAYGWDDFRGLSIENKAVLMKMGAPTRDGKPILPEEVHKLYASNYSWFRKMLALFPMKPAAIFLIPDQETLKDWESIPMKTQAPQIIYNNRNERAFHVPCICVIKPEVAKAIFVSQVVELPWTGQPGRGNDKSRELENVSLTLNASFKEEDIPTWNVIGAVEGTDPVLKSEYVAVTAHLDHLKPQKQGEIYPGSDDNASGSAGLMEIAQAAAMRPAKRSLIFVLFTGEEEAAIGSRHFVSACPVPLEKIVADINLDMIGRTDKASEKNRGAYAVGSERITTAFARLIKEVNSRTVRWPIQYENPLAVSDNIIFDAVHIPAVNFYSGSHSDVHQPTDTPDKIDYEKARKISQLVYEITMELGNRNPLGK